MLLFLCFPCFDKDFVNYDDADADADDDRNKDDCNSLCVCVKSKPEIFHCLRRSGIMTAPRGQYPFISSSC